MQHSGHAKCVLHRLRSWLLINTTTKIAHAFEIHNRGRGNKLSSIEMAERQQRQRLRALRIRNDRNLARFVVEGRATGKQLGTGSYGSVEEVTYSIIFELASFRLDQS